VGGPTKAKIKKVEKVRKENLGRSSPKKEGRRGKARRQDYHKCSSRGYRPDTDQQKGGNSRLPETKKKQRGAPEPRRERRPRGKRGELKKRTEKKLSSKKGER